MIWHKRTVQQSPTVIAHSVQESTVENNGDQRRHSFRPDQGSRRNDGLWRCAKCGTTGSEAASSAGTPKAALWFESARLIVGRRPRAASDQPNGPPSSTTDSLADQTARAAGAGDGPSRYRHWGHDRATPVDSGDSLRRSGRRERVAGVGAVLQPPVVWHDTLAQRTVGGADDGVRRVR